MQSAINELSESLATKDDIIATKDSTVREHFKRIREMANMAHLKAVVGKEQAAAGDTPSHEVERERDCFERVA